MFTFHFPGRLDKSGWSIALLTYIPNFCVPSITSFYFTRSPSLCGRIPYLFSGTIGNSTRFLVWCTCVCFYVCSIITDKYCQCIRERILYFYELVCDSILDLCFGPNDIRIIFQIWENTSSVFCNLCCSLEEKIFWIL